MWHGANWTFVLFGFLHGLYYIPLILRGTMNKRRKISKDKLLPSLKEIINIITTFLLVALTNITFRSESIEQASGYYISLITNPFFSLSGQTDGAIHFDLKLIIMVLLSATLVILGWFQRNKEHVLQFDKGKTKRAIRWSIYYVLTFSILYFQGTYQQFIYFQF